MIRGLGCDMAEQKPSLSFTTIIVESKVGQPQVVLGTLDSEGRVCNTTLVTCALAGNGEMFEPWFRAWCSIHCKGEPIIMQDGATLYKNNFGVPAFVLAAHKLQPTYTGGDW